MKYSTAMALALMALAAPALAQEAIEPETLTVKETIDPGHNVFVMDQAWAGPSSVYVVGSDGLDMKGNMGPGTVGQMTLNAAGDTLFTSSVYLERYTYGEVTAVVHEWDVPTLTMKREIEVSNKMAQVESQPGLLTFVGGEGYLLAQNATPATSLSLVDLTAGAQIAEIPIPGCWLAIPAAEGMKFSTVCGDGTLKTFTFAADGTYSEPASSDKIFDVDDDALFTNPTRAGANLVFVSFTGNLYVVDDSGEVPVLVDKFSITEGTLGGWAPSGSELIAYHAPSDTAFVLMHSGKYDGSHKNAAEEIWAVNMTSKTVVGRGHAHHENGIAVTQTEAPIIFAASEEGALVKYDVTLGDEVTFEMAGEFEGLAGFPTLIKLDQ